MRFVNFLYSVPYIVSCFDRIAVLCNLARAFKRSRRANSSTRSYCAEQMKPLLHNLPELFVFFCCLFCCHFFLPLKWRLAAKSSLAVQPFCVVGYISWLLAMLDMNIIQTLVQKSLPILIAYRPAFNARAPAFCKVLKRFCCSAIGADFSLVVRSRNSSWVLAWAFIVRNPVELAPWAYVWYFHCRTSFLVVVDKFIILSLVFVIRVRRNWLVALCTD